MKENVNLLRKYLEVLKKRCTFATQLRVATYWTFSSAGLEHLPYKQRVGGSNPSTSTELKTYRTFSSAGLEHLPYKQRVGGSNPSTSTEVEPAHCVGYFFLHRAAMASLFCLFCINFVRSLSVYG